jgi:hypothetical protein
MAQTMREAEAEKKEWAKDGYSYLKIMETKAPTHNNRGYYFLIKGKKSKR